MSQVATHTEALAEALDRDGFVVFRDVVSPDDLAALDAELTTAWTTFVDGGELFQGGGTISGHLNCFPGEAARFAWENLTAAGIIDFVRAVRPDIADSVRATLNYNLPGSVAQHYHMDGVYKGEFLICNVAVVDTDLQNGAIDVLPGTNLEWHPFWRYALHRRYRLTTRVPVRRGDVILRKSTLWHRGMPNRSAVPRPMLAITFGEMGDEGDIDPFSEHGAGITFYPNWYRTGRLGRLRERTFVKAPITYAAYRFARSLKGNKGYESF